MPAYFFRSFMCSATWQALSYYYCLIFFVKKNGHIFFKQWKDVDVKIKNDKKEINIFQIIVNCPVSMYP